LTETLALLVESLTAMAIDKGYAPKKVLLFQMLDDCLDCGPKTGGEKLVAHSNGRLIEWED